MLFDLQKVTMSRAYKRYVEIRFKNSIYLSLPKNYRTKMMYYDTVSKLLAVFESIYWK